jgi:hypothetical protein
MEFAAIKTPDQLTAFITKFGPLTNDKRQAAIDLIEEARRMRECMKDKRASPGRSLNLSSLLIRNPKTDELEISMTPRSLLDALWLQFQQSQASGAVFRTCPLCLGSFAAGGNTGRARKAQFCSPEHRKRYHSLARTDPSMRARHQAASVLKKRQPIRRGERK